MIPTTLVRITDNRILLGMGHQLWTTLEGENPGGSIKDRMVKPELLELKSRGITYISEISAGSTALSLAFYTQEFGLKCQLFVPDNIDKNLKEKLIHCGAQLVECDPKKAYEEYEVYCQSSNNWRFGQMQKKELRLHYKKWAENALGLNLPCLDLVIGSVGTGHSLLGVKLALNPKFGCVVAEPKFDQPVSGIRNLTHQNFGQSDSCEQELIEHRLEIDKTQFYVGHHIESDHGIISISDSFRLTLGAAVSFLNKTDKAAKVFLVGSHCRLSSK